MRLFVASLFCLALAAQDRIDYIQINSNPFPDIPGLSNPGAVKWYTMAFAQVSEPDVEAVRFTVEYASDQTADITTATRQGNSFYGLLDLGGKVNVRRITVVLLRKVAERSRDFAPTAAAMRGPVCNSADYFIWADGPSDTIMKCEAGKVSALEKESGVVARRLRMMLTGVAQAK